MPNNFDFEPSNSSPPPKARGGFGSWLSPPGLNRSRLATLQFAPLYICAGGLLLLLLWTVIGLLLPPGTSKLWGQLLAYGLFTISAITPAFAMAKLEDRRFGDYGLPGKTAFGPRFWAGCIAGLLALSLLVVGLDWLGCLKVEGVALHGLRTLKFALFWGLFFLLVALWEEFAFRGYLLFALARAIGFWPAAVISSLVFGYTHRSNAGETWVGALGAAAIGFFFCLTRRRTGNLWFAVGLHASWDWAQSFLYGVPDSGTVEPGHLLKSGVQGPPWLSGGPAGPEGSVLLFALLAVMWVAFDRLYPSAPEAAAGAGKTDPLKPMGDPQPATKNSEPCR